MRNLKNTNSFQVHKINIEEGDFRSDWQGINKIICVDLNLADFNKN